MDTLYDSLTANGIGEAKTSMLKTDQLNANKRHLMLHLR
jgi:hypothetical protein